ncbi:hypothetical protein MKEN_01254200 [Mycena kentingensis (nom. inval.)]|nr:hypothetical protein MKEN_01254200 [Mycena kentingensis (nom. inval.)]
MSSKAPSSPGDPSPMDSEISQCSAIARKLAQAEKDLRRELESLTKTDEIYKNLKKQDLIRRQCDLMKQELYSLQLRKIAQNARFSFSPESIESIRAVCADIGNTTAVVAAFCASISISILFGAVRGNLFFFFAAWWCSIIALTSGLGLSVLSTKRRDTSGKQPANADATDKDWWRIHVSGWIVGFCLLAAVGSIVSLCYGAMTLDVSAELGADAADPRIKNGPKIPNGVPRTTIIIGTVIIAFICGGAFFAIFAGPFRFSARRRWAQKYNFETHA